MYLDTATAPRWPVYVTKSADWHPLWSFTFIWIYLPGRFQRYFNRPVGETPPFYTNMPVLASFSGHARSEAGQYILVAIAVKT